MKIYIWENVLCDYTCGMVVVYAKSLSEAREQIGKYLESWEQEELKVKEPEIIDCKSHKKPDIFWARGGG